MNSLTIDTPIGLLCIYEEGGAVVGCLPAASEEMQGEASPVLIEAKRQLEAYFQGERQGFDLPIHPHGSEFERSVWAILETIPYGEAMTYGQIAICLNKPGAARAVGHACARNPILVLIPCHRVMGTNMKLTGFAAGLEAKKTLLSLENIQFR